MTDVWDLTDKERGDHVLIALTPEECRSLVAAINEPVYGPDEEARRAAEEIRRCLRDQKGIEA